jgi:hypothetical protein
VAVPEVPEEVHHQQAARHRRDNLKVRAQDNALVAAQAARQLEAEGRAWLI